MKCPRCKTEMSIRERKEEDGQLKMVFTCRSKQCSNFGKAVNTIYLPVDAPQTESE